MLAERGHGRGEMKTRTFKMRQLALRKARMGIRYHGQSAEIPSNGFFI
jgi:hypothetical protein